jgi:hypothetical protein
MRWWRTVVNRGWVFYILAFVLCGCGAIREDTRGGSLFNRILAQVFPATTDRQQEASTQTAHEATRVYIKNGKYGFVDLSGTAPISSRYEDAQDFEGEYAAVKERGQWEVIDRKGKVILVSRWPELVGISDGLVIFKASNGRFGYADLRGKVILENLVEARPFSEGLAQIAEVDTKTSGQSRTYINRRGRYVDKGRRFLIAGPFHYGRAVVGVVVEDELLFGVVDQRLAYVVKPKYPGADVYGGYGDGLLGVVIKRGADNSEDRCGFIDVNGILVLETTYSDVQVFSYNRAVVIQGGFFVTENRVAFDRTGSWKVIDRYNNAIAESSEWAFVNTYSDGFALIVLLEGSKRRYAFLGLDGKVVFDHGYSDAKDFQKGMAYIERAGHKGYLTTAGAEIWWDSLP